MEEWEQGPGAGGDRLGPGQMEGWDAPELYMRGRKWRSIPSGWDGLEEQEYGGGLPAADTWKWCAAE